MASTEEGRHMDSTEQQDGRVGSIIKPETRVLSTGVIDGSNADRDIPRFGAE
jgi:hypothetical protein